MDSNACENMQTRNNILRQCYVEREIPKKHAIKT